LLRHIGPHTPAEFVDSAEAERIRTVRALWLVEGFADNMAQETTAALSFTEGDVFDTGGALGVDSTCAAYLADPANERVTTAIGSPGELSELFTENRETVAPAFCLPLDKRIRSSRQQKAGSDVRLTRQAAWRMFEARRDDSATSARDAE
jgi:hypothetical protein